MVRRAFYLIPLLVLISSAALAGDAPLTGTIEAVKVVANISGEVLEYDGTVRWGPVVLPGGGQGGAPVVADLDGEHDEPRRCLEQLGSTCHGPRGSGLPTPRRRRVPAHAVR